MGKQRGIIYGGDALLRWSSASPNSRLAALGFAIASAAWFIHRSSLIPVIIVRVRPQLATEMHADFMSITATIVVFGFLIAESTGITLILLAAWRAIREMRKEATKDFETNPRLPRDPS